MGVIRMSPYQGFFNGIGLLHRALPDAIEEKAFSLNLMTLEAIKRNNV